MCFFDIYLAFQEGDCEKNEQGRFSAKLIFIDFGKILPSNYA